MKDRQANGDLWAATKYIAKIDLCHGNTPLIRIDMTKRK